MRASSWLKVSVLCVVKVVRILAPTSDDSTLQYHTVPVMSGLKVTDVHVVPCLVVQCAVLNLGDTAD